MRRASAAVLAAVLLAAAAAAPAAAKEGAMCGGIAGLDCDAGEYCEWLPGMCPPKVKDASGVCRPRVSVCPPATAPVCGCDGRTYPSACEAGRAGAAISHDGRCG